MARTLVVIGNGMVGHRLCERLTALDTDRRWRIVTFCEEPRAAYDRVCMTQYFSHRDPAKLAIADPTWYTKNGIELFVGERATSIDRAAHVVVSSAGRRIAYDGVVLATGSAPFVPPLPGVKKEGVFVYRTIEDLEAILAWGAGVKTAAVIGGGLLGLEAAKAASDMGLKTHVVEFAPRLMPRQLDDKGARILKSKIESLGVSVHVGAVTEEICGNGKVEALALKGGTRLEVGMVIVSAGIRPRDELAKECGLEVGARGGVTVNDKLETSDPQIFAIGEVALHRGMIYGLVAPGYDMAEVLAHRLAGDEATFEGADLSTKLKLMGVDVASFGDYTADERGGVPLLFEDPIAGVYKKLVFDAAGTRLIGGMLVGDAADYGRLLAVSREKGGLAEKPAALLGVGGGAGPSDMPDTAQVCSCNNVTKGQICAAIREKELTTIGAVKSCTKAGTGCGGCLPMVIDLLNKELKAAGRSINKNLCEHFAFTRQEVMDIVKVKEFKTFDALIAAYGRGDGCEICKPAVASMLASLWNEPIMKFATIQDTNDRFLANMQRGGVYSVIPRVPGGEITPEQLIAMGTVARKYGLYTKITGGQRIDLFGAQVHQLPDIWEELVAAGLESGHAYGKALRTVKSCVGTTWCRYGVQDSVGFAVRVEKRYRGIRAPHKVKAAVSGCVRECAEAQGKDFGLIATEKGYSLYVCGNGGAKPRHADLLAADLDEDTAIKYLDRFMMYYILTADRLTRTAPWIENMPGGIEHLKDVIIKDKLGICAELEKRLQFLVDGYECEWTAVVKDPAKRALFRQFVNTEETESGIEFVDERGQQRPDFWEKDVPPEADPLLPKPEELAAVRAAEKRWVRVGTVADFPVDGGQTVKVGKAQIAVYHFKHRNEWYATQNMCPHKKAFVLSRGIVGDAQGTPKIACPLHKKNFSLKTGACISGEKYELMTFPVKVEGDQVWLELPRQDKLDALLATERYCPEAVKPRGPAKRSLEPIVV